jgi:drug/metabolite transporter (DMT)-like permease
LGVVFLDERLALWTGLGAALILAGVSLALAESSKFKVQSS